MELEAVGVDPATAALVANGRVLPAFDGAGPWALFRDGTLIAVYERFHDREIYLKREGNEPAHVETRVRGGLLDLGRRLLGKGTA